MNDLDALEKEWLEYIASIPIDAPDARLKRGLRSAMMGEYKESMEDLTAAIDAGLTDPRAFSTRAVANALGSKMSVALEDINHAIELDPLNAQHHFDRSHYLLGIPSFRNFTSEKKNVFEKAENLAEARKEAGLAVSLDPENRFFPDWRKMLGAE